MHYSLDLWVTRKFAKTCTGIVRLIRYADDFVVCFQLANEAEVFRLAMEERLKQFDLEIAPEKTHCIEFEAFEVRRGREG